MEFTKHLVISLEANAIQSWLDTDSDSALGPPDTVNPPQFRSRRRTTQKLIRRLYAKLVVQMVITFIIVGIASAERNPIEEFLGTDQLHLKVVTAYYFLSIIILLTIVPYRHQFPWNYTFLFLLTLGSSCSTATATIEYHLWVQVKAVGSTVVIALLLTLYAFKTNIDFTVMGQILYYALAICFIGGMVSMAQFSKTNLFYVLHSFYGILVFAFFIIYDTQIMIGGNHFVRIDPSRHTYITINIYVDLQMMFCYHLHIFNYFSIRAHRRTVGPTEQT